MNFNSNYILNPSSIPFFLSISMAFFLSSILVFFKFGYYYMLLFSFLFLVYSMKIWAGFLVWEAKAGMHVFFVSESLKFCFLLFLVSEVMFFFSMFWYFFDFSLVKMVEMSGSDKGLSKVYPFGIPLINTMLLLASSVFVTYSHNSLLMNKSISKGLFYAIVFGVMFLSLQILEYKNSPISFNDSSFGSIFFMMTGFHGMHVCLGLIFLVLNLITSMMKETNSAHHLGFELTLIYWHFVDLIWLFLFVFIYFWFY